MQSIALEFATEEDLNEATRLIDRLNVTGEVAIRPLGGGRWRMDIHAERPIRESSLERLKARRLSAGQSAGDAGAPPEERSGDVDGADDGDAAAGREALLAVAGEA